MSRIVRIIYLNAGLQEPKKAVREGGGRTETLVTTTHCLMMIVTGEEEALQNHQESPIDTTQMIVLITLAAEEVAPDQEGNRENISRAHTIPVLLIHLRHLPIHPEQVAPLYHRLKVVAARIGNHRELVLASLAQGLARIDKAGSANHFLLHQDNSDQ